MKRLIQLSTIIIATTLASPVLAAEKATTAIIDVNRILSESKAAKGLNDQMNTLRTNYEKDIYKQEEDLRAQERKLEGLKGEALEKARKDLEGKVAKFQKEIMMQQNKMQQAAQNAMDQIREKVVNISNEVAKSQNFVYVQPAAGFLYYPKEADITSATITKLDKDLPSVKLTVGADTEKTSKETTKANKS